jgi:hypothetical protein
VSSVEYKQLAKAKVSVNRNIVISECSKGGYTLAQQLDVNEKNATMNVFLKGAFHIDDVEGLIELRDAINLVISQQDSK